MAFKNKVSIQEAATSAVTGLQTDISAATKRADNALSTFRVAADELVAANADLATVNTTLDKIGAQIEAQKATISLQMADNSAVADKIYELITPKK